MDENDERERGRREKGGEKGAHKADDENGAAL